MAGSAPAICTEIGSTSPSWFARRSVFSLPHNSEFDATISDTARPAPKFLHSCLKGRSVTPAIGATNRLLRSACEPIRIDDHGKLFRAGAQFYTENRTIREALLPLRSKNSADAEIFSSRSAETAPRLLQGSARVPKIMRRARKRRAGGEASSAAKRKRERRARAGGPKISHPPAEGLAQAREKLRIGEPEQVFSRRRPHAPNQGVAVTVRQQSERPLGRKAFPGDAAARPLGFDLGDDCALIVIGHVLGTADRAAVRQHEQPRAHADFRSEEHTSELQSLAYLVCRLLL